MKNTFYKDENFCLQWEYWKDDKVLIHCTVAGWKLSSFKKGLQVFGAMQDFLVKEGFTEMWTCTPNPRFVKLLGGRYVSEGIYENKEYEVYKWDLIQ
jgi:Ni,Fe-hydrogenase III small subunit